MQPANICQGRLSGSVRILPWRSTITTATAITTSPAWRRTGVMRCGKSRSMSRIWNNLENQGNGREFHVWNHMTEGFYMTGCLKFREEKIDYKNWTMPENEAYEFLMNEVLYRSRAGRHLKISSFICSRSSNILNTAMNSITGQFHSIRRKRGRRIGDMLQELPGQTG